MAKKQKEAVVEEIKDTAQKQEVKQPENKGEVTKVKMKSITQEDDVIKVDLTNHKKKKKMPFRSKAQMRFLYATNPKLAKKFKKETTKKQMKNLPEKAPPYKMINPLLKK